VFNKIVVGVFVFFLVAAVILYLFLNRGFVKLPFSSKEEVSPIPAQTASRGAVTKTSDGYLLLGRFSTDLKLKSDGNLEGFFILMGDPNQTQFKVLLVPEEYRISLGKYQGSFQGALSVERISAQDVVPQVKKEGQAELKVLFTKERPLKGYESLVKDTLENLTSGSWNIPTPTSTNLFVVISNYVGIIE